MCVFALDWAEKAPEIRPSMPPGFVSRQLGPNPSLDLGEPQRPCAYSPKRYIDWEHALPPTQLTGSILQKVCGTMVTDDLPLSY